MKFTKEEIDLCKQVAERHVKEIHYGVWVAEDKGKTIKVSLWNLPIGLTERQRKEGKWTPLWTISDCLEFMREKEHSFERAEQLGGIFDVSFISGEGTKKGSGDTLREACLKAVLAVLEEVKK